MDGYKCQSSVISAEIRATCRRVTEYVCDVIPSRHINSMNCPIRKETPIVINLGIMVAIEPGLNTRFIGHGMRYPAIHEQEHGNAPKSFHEPPCIMIHSQQYISCKL
ncbi:hypothetical protein TNCV_485041 [Trichonephila clavipes]|nr:hypothetical protein TNCV_485041 [Trichonephila clavipes]